MLKTSPFHSRTAPLVRAQTWRRWAGHQMASAYDPQPDREYAAIRNAAAMIDVSPLYKYMITGRDAARLLDREAERVVDPSPRDVLVAGEPGEDRQPGGVGRRPAGRAQLVRAEVEDRARPRAPAAAGGR